MEPESLSKMSPQEIKAAVCRKYSQVAESPENKFNFPVGRKFAESVGYPASQLDLLPNGLYESFTGANNPQPHVNLSEHESLLDLGCGAGLDLYFYSRKSSNQAQLYGLDISSSMLKKTSANLNQCGVENLTLVQASADQTPFPADSFDIVSSNGIYNLSPDKKAVMQEVYRILKPGGRTIFSEIVLKAPLETEIRKNINDWFRCIGGALTKTEFINQLKEVGFKEVQILSQGRNARTGHKLAIFGNIAAYKST